MRSIDGVTWVRFPRGSLKKNLCFADKYGDSEVLFFCPWTIYGQRIYHMCRILHKKIVHELSTTHSVNEAISDAIFCLADWMSRACW